MKHAEKSASEACSKEWNKLGRSDKGKLKKVASSVEDFAATLGGLSVDRAKDFL